MLMDLIVNIDNVSFNVNENGAVTDNVVFEGHVTIFKAFHSH